MTTSTVVFMASALVVVLIAAYLTVAKCYRTGLVGAFGFLGVALGFGSMLFEWASGVTFEILPQVATGTAGLALFLLQHFTRTRRFRRKRESSLGAPDKAFPFSEKEC